MKRIIRIFGCALVSTLWIVATTPLQAQRNEKQDREGNNSRSVARENITPQSRTTQQERTASSRSLERQNKSVQTESERSNRQQQAKEGQQFNRAEHATERSVQQNNERNATNRNNQSARQQQTESSRIHESDKVMQNNRGEISERDFERAVSNRQHIVKDYDRARNYDRTNNGNYNAENNIRYETQRVNDRNVRVYHNNHNYYQNINRLPDNCKRYDFHGNNYYYSNNTFYRSWGGGYQICRPPIGAYFAAALFTTALVAITVNAINNATATPYYYDDGSFYQLHNDNYYVVDPPIGAIVPALPYGFEEVIIENNLYYRVDNTYYAASGIGFRVVGKVVQY